MKTTKYREVKIPVKPYLLKYARYIYGDTIKADSATALGSYVRLSLEKNIYENRNIKTVNYSQLTATLTVLINIWQFDRLGFDLSDDNVIGINKFLESAFDEALYQFCRYRVNNDKRYGGRDAAIESFADMHGIDIEKDISFEAIKKKEYRVRMRRQQPAPRPATLF